MSSTPKTLQARLAARIAAIASTEAESVVKRRVGQELFREALLDYWDGRCAVSGLAVPELLRASHAKPWADSTDAERLDVHNGLLLAVQLDALFDRGLLTFDEHGTGRLSSTLSLEALEALGLGNAGLHLSRLTPAHLPFLSYHRERVFRA
jgi:predicted restriction endonuclease